MCQLAAGQGFPPTQGVQVPPKHLCTSASLVSLLTTPLVRRAALDPSHISCRAGRLDITAPSAACLPPPTPPLRPWPAPRQLRGRLQVDQGTPRRQQMDLLSVKVRERVRQRRAETLGEQVARLEAVGGAAET